MPGNRSPLRPAETLEPDCSDDISILEHNIQKQLYDDVASDVYTECNIKLQEDQIISYLNNTCLNELDTRPQHKVDKQNNSKELIEEDVFSNDNENLIVTVKKNKPTISSLRQSKPIRPSKSCDFNLKISNEKEDIYCQHSNPSEQIKTSPISDCFVKPRQNSEISDNLTDDQKSVVTTSEVQLNVTSNKMTNIYPSTDSGLENTVLLESLSSHKTTTLTDISLTESHLCDLLEDPTDNAQDSIADNNKILNAPVFKTEDEFTYDSPCDDNLTINKQVNIEKDKLTSINPKTGKQRENIEIVFLESSVSSPWTPGYMPKLSVKEACETFVTNECLYSNQDLNGVKNSQSKSYFIDAANLVDETNNPVTSPNIKETSTTDDECFKIRSRPLPNWSQKGNLSPTEWTDSIIDLNIRDTDPDLAEKELSPSMCDPTPLTEDSLSVFEDAEQGDKSNINLNTSAVNKIQDMDLVVPTDRFTTSTPNNSIMFLNGKTPNKNQPQVKSTELNNTTRIIGRNSSTLFYYTAEETALENSSSLSGQIDDVPIISDDAADKITETSLITMAPPQTLDEKQKPVKLADLENWYPKLNSLNSTNNEDAYDVRMTRSIPNNNWREHDPVSRSSGSQRILSFHSENATSLNRLFPNLKRELSKSMPGSLSSTTVSSLRFGCSPTPGESQEHISELSHSSIQSAGDRFAFENSTTEDSSLTSSILKNCQSRLGQDLLRMFLEEIAPDVIVEVDSRKIKAHKCILSSRCQYFAAILSGTWVESAGNVITMPPFSYSVVHFALCHIYAGIVVLPKSINIVELAIVADILCLEGLKEVIMHKLKDKYCHNFHMPCVVCTAGVLECFSLSSLYGLDDLYRKCLNWITKYFSKIWPTKFFELLPKGLLDKCYQQLIINLSMDNLFETVYGCGLAASAMQGVHSADTVWTMCRRAVTAAAQFAAQRLVAALRAVAAVPPDAPRPALAAIHKCVENAIECAPPDEACRAYAFLSTLLKDIHDKPHSPQVKYDNFLHANASKWYQLCERVLVNEAPRVVVTQAFKDLSLSLRKRLRELGCIKYSAQPKLNAPTTFHDAKKKNSTTSSSATLTLDIDHVRTSFVPYASKPIATMNKGLINTSTKFHGHSKVPLPKVRITKAQEERAKYNMMKSQQTYNRSAATGPIRASSLSNVKSRVAGKEERKPGPKKPSSVKSGGECSGRLGAIPRESTSQGSLATSSRPRTGEPPVDSLSLSQNNKYATFTKSKSPKNRQAQEQEKNSPQQPMMKTRIPVYFNPKVQKCEKQTNITERNVCKTNKASTSNVRRNFVGSLMNATKSSSAKIVPKVVKEQNVTPKRSKDNSMNKSDSKSSEKNVSGIERSETFLKDEPTFGDKTTKID